MKSTTTAITRNAPESLPIKRATSIRNTERMDTNQHTVNAREKEDVRNA